MMELETFFTVSEQTRLLFCAVLLGAPLGLCYDGLRTLRLLLPHEMWIIALEDISFLLLWGGGLICFSAVLARGEIRGYFFLGSLLGFLLYRCTIGACTVPLLRRILEILFCFLRWIFRPVFHGIVRICRSLHEKFGHFAEVFKKRAVFLRLPLNQSRKMLYNKRKQKKRRFQKNGK